MTKKFMTPPTHSCRLMLYLFSFLFIFFGTFSFSLMPISESDKAVNIKGGLGVQIPEAIAVLLMTKHLEI